MTNNIKKNKNHCNDVIEHELKFYNIFSLSSDTKYPLTVVTTGLRGGKKQRARMISGLTLLWSSRATDSMIKRKYTKHYELMMRYNKVEYSTATGKYCTTHDANVTCHMLDFISAI